MHKKIFLVFIMLLQNLSGSAGASVEVIEEKNGEQIVIIQAKEKSENSTQKASIDDPSQWQEAYKI